MEPSKNILLGDVAKEYKAILPFIFKYGCIGLAIMVLISIIQTFVVGPKQSEGFSIYAFVSFAISVLSYIIYLLLMVLGVDAYKKSNGGFVSLRRAFGVTYLKGLFIAVFTMIFSIFILYAFGMDMMPKMLDGSSPFESYSIKLILIASLAFFFINCILGAIAALIISAIMKRDKPVSFNLY